MSTHIAIDTESLQINGCILPRRPSLDDFTAILGPNPRHELGRPISSPPYHHWIWDECGVRVDGSSSRSLRCVIISPKPAPKTALYGGPDGFELLSPRSGLNGMLMIFGVTLDPGDSPRSFHTRVYNKKPATTQLSSSGHELSLEDDSTFVNLETLPGPRSGDLPSFGRSFLMLYSYKIDARRFWEIGFYFPDEDEKEAPQGSGVAQRGCASLLLAVLCFSIFCFAVLIRV